tara:strand:+ start:401 stop:1054 length:654 start_codon:yes stop_codon:yes gene_type:complete
MAELGVFRKYLNVFRFLNPDYASALEKEVSKFDGWLSNHQISLMWLVMSQLEGVAVEVGCWKGRATFTFLANIPRDQFSLHCVDTFLGSEEHQDSLKGASTRPDFEKNLKEKGLLEEVNIIQKESVKAAQEFADESLDLVFIDAAHDYENVKLDILSWLPKLKPHGLMIGHDYPDPTDPNGGFEELFASVNDHVRDSGSFYDFGYAWGLWGAKKSAK